MKLEIDHFTPNHQVPVTSWIVAFCREPTRSHADSVHLVAQFSKNNFDQVFFEDHVSLALPVP